ncbi:MAG: response regulator [Spirochaetia bacterium]|nr:response regulator [Spirochaetia bacterium]MBQ3647883.1 response regulator [Spirochaetia bacterium]MBQ3712464.1 response regulator [Spirochaetia bacterium]MBR0318237.1 response regulator [Spirochaetia bacterium]
MKILIVEDDPMVAHINLKFANKAGYDDVDTVSDIESAKERILNGNVDLVLLDVYLPTGKGTDLLKWIRQENLSTDAILITADHSSETVEMAMNFGAVDYLIKPFDFARFQLAMDKFERKKSGIVSKKSVEQDDIDSIFFDYATKSDKIKSVLDKGMSEKTYTTILDAIKSINAPTTAEELGDRLGISRVSVRRYLEFMETQGILEMKPVYGKKGRPQHLFKYVQEGN